MASNFTSSASSLTDLKALSGDDLSSIGASSGDMSKFNGAGFTFDPERMFAAVNEGAGNYLDIDESQQESWLVYAGGTHLANIIEDFSGTARSLDITENPPSLGAFEFTPNTTPIATHQIGAIADPGISDFYVGNRKIVSLKWNENGGSLPTSVKIHYYPGHQPPDTDGYPVFNGYIQVDAVGGSDYMYDIELAYEPALLAGISTNDILLTKRSDEVNDWSTWQTTVNTVSRVFTVKNIDNGFSYFTGTDQNNPLPINLISFSAKILNGKIEIRWETNSEKNNDHFTVEKKDINNDWRKIAIIKGAKNSNTIMNYSTVDLNPIVGTQYYRLKQVDTDGRFEYSYIVRVDYGTNKREVFPNPFIDQIFIKSKGEKSIKRIELKNIMGENINISTEYFPQDKWKINAPALQKGTYILFLYLENRVETRKLMKQ
ncbi:T9SS type A sorting domain-containing protein [Marivirga sp.]|uniref:T9SS type A sorting domain-containing protein n=1 Tax=Marivirga sp. TaxID=2018662 RepID=UPI002D805AF0|nr:T9SS type A sorting domain-containing protein [Marivirga sp.]HET8860972.1 T9SS type A sorting domain-containing protein [Marivirga sp.]